MRKLLLEGTRIGCFGNCVVNIWEGSLRTANLKQLEEIVRTTAEEYEDGVLNFVVVEPGIPLVDAEQRQDLENFYKRCNPLFRAVSQVVEGGNLWSVTARSVMTAMRLVQRRPYPLKVFSSVDDGAQWATQYMLPAVSDGGAALLRFIAELRSAQPS